LLVPTSITSPQDLAGKTVGDLDGSSEDYELRGWLAAEGLTGKVHVFGFASEPAVAAAYLGGRISAAFVTGVLASELKSKGAHSLTNAKMIASLGYSSVAVLVVTHADVVRYPRTVQNYICAELSATEDMFGPNGKTYFARSAPLIGIPVPLAVTASVENLRFWLPPDQELHWLSGGAASPLVSSYRNAASFDQAQGRITRVPSAATLAAHVNPSFAQYALAGKC
jgi:NitT/TauT family transport system substrate-binding protein